MARIEWHGPTIKLDDVRADVHQVCPPVGPWAWRVSDGQGRVCDGEEHSPTQAQHMAELMLRALAAALAERCPAAEGYPAVVDVCAGRWLAGSQPITPDAMCAT